jgi:hypothetical protein
MAATEKDFGCQNTHADMDTITNLQLGCLVILYIQQEDAKNTLSSTKSIYTHLNKCIAGVSTERIEQVIDDLRSFGIIKELQDKHIDNDPSSVWEISILRDRGI